MTHERDHKHDCEEALDSDVQLQALNRKIEILGDSLDDLGGDDKEGSSDPLADVSDSLDSLLS